jgi:predicted DNA-binding transcriptional regulator YafY
MQTLEKMLTLLRTLHERQQLDSYDESLLDRIGCSSKQLGRDLDALERFFDEIVKVREGKRYAYKLARPVAILDEAFAHDTLGLGMLFEMAREGMPEIVQEWDKTAHKLHKPYRFYNMPYETIGSFETDANFRSLKKAIQWHEYRSLDLRGDLHYPDIKPIKLLFSDGNWYVAYIDGAQLRIGRLAFIEAVRYGRRDTYPASEAAPYLRWLEEEFQNSFSLYAHPWQRAILYARPPIAHYFAQGMKRFLRTQEYIETTSEGGVRFQVRYTQEMEVLPFIRKWMPDLIIESPRSLHQAHQRDLRQALKHAGG